MTQRTRVYTPDTGTAVDILTDERTIATLSDGNAAKVQYFAEIDGTAGSDNVGVIDATGARLVTADALPLPSGAASSAKQDAEALLIGAVNETAPGTDTANSGVNGRLQRLAQHFTTFLTRLPAALGAGGGLKVDGSGTALPVSAAALPLPSGAATSALQTAEAVLVGAVNETAPATDTANSGLNGRLQRIAQHFTTFLTRLPAALGTGGGLKVDGSGTPLTVAKTLGTSAATEFTRPADTTAYTFGDVVGTSSPSYLTFASVTRSASSVGHIIGVQVSTDNWLCRQALRLHLWNAAPSTIPADNAVFEMEYTDKATYLGWIDLPACQSGPSSASGGATAVLREGLRFAFVSDGSSAIYGMLESRDSSTPTSAQKFYVSLTLDKN